MRSTYSPKGLCSLPYSRHACIIGEVMKLALLLSVSFYTLVVYDSSNATTLQAFPIYSVKIIIQAQIFMILPIKKN